MAHCTRHGDVHFAHWHTCNSRFDYLSPQHHAQQRVPAASDDACKQYGLDVRHRSKSSCGPRASRTQCATKAYGTDEPHNGRSSSLTKIYRNHHTPQGESISRRVHFDLPTRSRKHRHVRHSDHSRETSDPMVPHPLLKPPPSVTHPIARHMPTPNTPLQPTTSSLPTVYILTYALAQTSTGTAFQTLLNTHLPPRAPPITHLYTLNAATLTPPPQHLCATYSGLSPHIQTHVLRDPCARVAIRRAVENLLAFGRGYRKAHGSLEGMEVAMSVCCVMGTHRSVAVADMIALSVKSEAGRWGEGVAQGIKVVVRHVHRAKKPGDRF